MQLVHPPAGNSASTAGSLLRLYPRSESDSPVAGKIQGESRLPSECPDSSSDVAASRTQSRLRTDRMARAHRDHPTTRETIHPLSAVVLSDNRASPARTQIHA